jgi:hypothetical protein
MPRPSPSLPRLTTSCPSLSSIQLQLRSALQRPLFTVAPLDVLVTRDPATGRNAFHIIEINGTGIAGLSNMPDAVVGTVMRSLAELPGQLLAAVTDPVVLVASSGQESQPPVSRWWMGGRQQGGQQTVTKASRGPTLPYRASLPVTSAGCKRLLVDTLTRLSYVECISTAFPGTSCVVDMEVAVFLDELLSQDDARKGVVHRSAQARVRGAGATGARGQHDAPGAGACVCYCKCVRARVGDGVV